MSKSWESWYVFKLRLLVNLELPHVQSICTKVSSLIGNGEPQNTEPELPVWLLVTVTTPAIRLILILGYLLCPAEKEMSMDLNGWLVGGGTAWCSVPKHPY